MKELIKETALDIRKVYSYWNFAAMLTLMVILLQNPDELIGPGMASAELRLLIVIFYGVMILGFLVDVARFIYRRIAFEKAYQDLMDTPMHEDYQ